MLPCAWTSSRIPTVKQEWQIRCDYRQHPKQYKYSGERRPQESRILYHGPSQFFLSRKKAENQLTAGQSRICSRASYANIGVLRDKSEVECSRRNADFFSSNGNRDGSIQRARD